MNILVGEEQAEADQALLRIIIFVILCSCGEPLSCHELVTDEEDPVRALSGSISRLTCSGSRCMRRTQEKKCLKLKVLCKRFALKVEIHVEV